MRLSTVRDYLIQPGSVGVIPTDTVYGLVARASDKKAVRRLYRLKDRENKPGTIIAANIDQLVALGLKKSYLTAVKDYWPGPLSVIIPTGDELEYLHLGKFGLAVRLPKGDELIALLNNVGPLLTSSANTTNQPTARNIEEAKNYFSDQVDFYIDGGDLIYRQPSTIVRVVDDVIEVVRQGALKIG